jgi:hypothetical protein
MGEKAVLTRWFPSLALACGFENSACLVEAVLEAPELLELLLDDRALRSRKERLANSKANNRQGHQNAYISGADFPEALRPVQREQSRQPAACDALSERGVAPVVHESSLLLLVLGLELLERKRKLPGGVIVFLLQKIFVLRGLPSRTHKLVRCTIKPNKTGNKIRLHRTDHREAQEC